MDFLYPISKKHRQAVRTLEKELKPKHYVYTPIDVFSKNMSKIIDTIQYKTDKGFQDLQKLDDSYRYGRENPLETIQQKMSEAFQNLFHGLEKIKLSQRQIQDRPPLQWKKQIYLKQNSPSTKKDTKQQQPKPAVQQISTKQNKTDPPKKKIQELETKIINTESPLAPQAKQKDSEQYRNLSFTISHQQLHNDDPERNIPMTDKPQRKLLHQSSQRLIGQNSNLSQKKSSPRHSHLYRIKKSAERKHSLIRQKQAELQLKANIQFLEGLKGKKNMASGENIKHEWKQESPINRKKNLVDYVKEEKKKKMESLGFKNSHIDRQTSQHLQSTSALNSGESWEFLPQIRKQRQKGQIFKPVAFSIYAISQKGHENFENPKNLN